MYAQFSSMSFTYIAMICFVTFDILIWKVLETLNLQTKDPIWAEDIKKCYNMSVKYHFEKQSSA